MPLQPGTRLGNYEVLSELGSGGMGEVYKAKDLKLGRDVAIKVLPQEMASDSSRLRRFEQEARAASTLNHPNIVTIYEIGEHEGTPFIAMEYVKGRTLREILADGPLPNDKLIRYATQMAEGLAKAHQAGIVHRDLKPENIIISDDGYVKILDFGLAKLLPLDSVGSEVATMEKQATTPGTILGTVGYMSPEQAKGEDADFRSDQFSLGSVLYEMLTGQAPFERESATETLSAILRDEPTRLKDAVRDAPSGLEAILRRCLSKHPRTRYDSTAQLRAELDQIESSSTRDAVVRSIAVLPLANLSADPEQEYFSDGMTEALITELAKISALKVISRTSAMRYKRTDKSLPEIANELGVDAIVEGSVLRAGERVRITGQLIEATTDQHLWAESYERDLGDILALQSEVACAIAREVKVKLTPEERIRLEQRPRVNPEAHEAYFRGRYHFSKWTEEAIEKSIGHLRRAIDIDPTYPLAYAGLADCYVMLSVFAFDPPDTTAPKAKAAARKALELDDSLGEAQAALGGTELIFDWDWARAGKDIERAVELNPGSAMVHQYQSVYSTTAGRFDEGIEAATRAVNLDPLTATTSNHLGYCHFLARRYDESIVQLEKTIELDPTIYFPHMHLAWIHVIRQELDEALSECEKTLALLPIPDEPYALGTAGWALAKAGKPDEARELLTQLQRGGRRWTDPANVAMLHTGLGDREAAFERLEEAWNKRSPTMVFLKVHPLFDDLRDDPRFQDLLRRMNFPE